MAHSTPAFPIALDDVRRRLERRREAHPPRTRIPRGTLVACSRPRARTWRRPRSQRAPSPLLLAQGARRVARQSNVRIGAAGFIELWRNPMAALAASSAVELPRRGGDRMQISLRGAATAIWSR
jgi:hypothetical protein